MGGRARKESYLDGPAGSKFRTNNLKGGLGASALVLEQTLLNIPQTEIEKELDKTKQLLGFVDDLIVLRHSDLLRSPKQRSYVRLNDLTTARVQLQQWYQVLAGYTTRKAEVSIEAVQEALATTESDLGKLESFLSALDEKIEARREQLALAGVSLGDDSMPEGAVLYGEEEGVLEGEVVEGTISAQEAMERHRFLLESGLMSLDGAYSGAPLPPDAPEWAAKWVSDAVKASVSPSSGPPDA